MLSNNYDASNITVLKGLEAVRKRPAMYIGSTDVNGLHHLVWEIIDNSIDEALAGYADRIKVVLNRDGSVTVDDNGRGIPVDIHPTEKVSALELAATVLHAGGKFNNETYKVSSGLHGVGLSVTNALSKYCLIKVFKDGKVYAQEYNRGVPREPVKVVGETSRRGTVITFLPDDEIFPITTFNLKTILSRVRQHAYLNGKIKFIVIDNRTKTVDSRFKVKLYKFDGGLRSFVKNINKDQKVIQENIFHIKSRVEEIEVEVALQYTEDIQTYEYAFANNVINPDGGTHLAGLRLALTKAIINYQSKFATEKDKQIKIVGEDVREGLTVAISVKLKNPQFEGQTKGKLNNVEVTHVVRKVVEEEFGRFLEENPQDAKSILAKILLSSKARVAAKAARESVIKKSIFESSDLPGKLADCSSRDPKERELFIVEGDSAGGSAKIGRDRNFQAVFAMFGKPINSEKYRIDRVLLNPAISDLIKALGCGIGESFDIKKLRYHKIILMSDADVDGSHIRTLLLTLLYRHLRQLVENGHVYISQPPLYKVTLSSNKSVWVKDDEELKKLEDEYYKKSGSKKEPLQKQRFKGLGEMNPEQLWETTINPSTRTLKKIFVKDLEEANRKFDILMGEDVRSRRLFIEENSSIADLDI
ncbi:DNA gyrase subunit B [Candidatus Dojkabacteria bacterium]|uniref:DNA topoisomerase (ATP-hydrolyzing) n=1 Tax=Candidatus Dojkabacteria bacterium TaxID=2099670 RepID=A0A3M0Z4M4_9BACT|nr:MAG: DNA gyrase subunit B [Candidatus Dojkabacteria bacterium]